MLKSITPEDVSIGMYIHSISGNWMDHPFWRKSFKVVSHKEVMQLKNCDGRIWIDTDKGADILFGAGHGEQPLTDSPPTMDEVSLECADLIRSSRAGGDVDERRDAAQILASSQLVVLNMFAEVRMGKAINVKEVGELVTEIAASVASNAGALISLARLKTADNYTYMHSVAVCAMMISLGNQLGLSAEECRQAGMAGLLHDVGKMVVPTEILNKPSKLTDDEFVSMRAHAIRGHAILSKIPGLGEGPIDVALHHHEKIDGTGYPHNLRSEQISKLAKMGAICDVYDAITSNRPYKAGWDPAQSIRHMANSTGHFDPIMLSAFVKAIGIYPVGSCVLLKSGRIAVVMERGEAHLLAPTVKVFFSTTKREPVEHELVDLECSSDKIVSWVNPEKWGSIMSQRGISSDHIRTSLREFRSANPNRAVPVLRAQRTE